MSAPTGFPGGPVVKNPPASAGDMGLIPGWGRRATGPLARGPPLLKPTRLEPALCNNRSLYNDYTTQLDSSPRWPQQREPVHSNEDRAQPEMNFFLNK